MKAIIGSMALALAVCSTSHAQTAAGQPSRWTDPSGAFTLAFPHDWETFRGGSSGRDTILAVGPRGSQTGNRLWECTLSLVKRRMPRSLTQAEANEIVSRWDAAHVARMRSDDLHVVRYSNELIGGVQVASIVHDMNPEGGTRMYQRHFFLVRGEEVRFYSLFCGASLRGDEADLAAMDAFVDSLAFTIE